MQINPGLRVGLKVQVVWTRLHSMAELAIGRDLSVPLHPNGHGCHRKTPPACCEISHKALWYHNAKVILGWKLGCSVCILLCSTC